MYFASKTAFVFKKYFPRIVRLHLCNISLTIVDKHIWQWMWTVVIFQVTMKLRTRRKQIRLLLFSIYVFVNIRESIHICTQSHSHVPVHASFLNTCNTYTLQEFHLHRKIWNSKCIETRTTANERNSHCQAGQQIMHLLEFQLLHGGMGHHLSSIRMYNDLYIQF